MGDYIKKNDAELIIQSANMAAVAAANAVALGLSGAITGLLTTQQDVFSTAVTDANTARNTAEASRENKDLRKKELIGTMRMVAQMVQANPNVSDSLREQLGLPVRDESRTPSAVPTATPVPEVEKVGGAQVVLKVANSETGKVGRPDGAKLQVFEKIVGHGEAAPAGIDQMSLVDVATAGRITRSFESSDLCKTAYYGFRYVNTKGEPGPVSIIIPASIAA